MGTREAYRCDGSPSTTLAFAGSSKNAAASLDDTQYRVENGLGNSRIGIRRITGQIKPRSSTVMSFGKTTEFGCEEDKPLNSWLQVKKFYT